MCSLEQQTLTSDLVANLPVLQKKKKTRALKSDRVPLRQLDALCGISWKPLGMWIIRGDGKGEGGRSINGRERVLTRCDSRTETGRKKSKHVYRPFGVPSSVGCRVVSCDASKSRTIERSDSRSIETSKASFGRVERVLCFIPWHPLRHLYRHKTNENSRRTVSVYISITDIVSIIFFFFIGIAYA